MRTGNFSTTSRIFAQQVTNCLESGKIMTVETISSCSGDGTMDKLTKQGKTENAIIEITKETVQRDKRCM